MRTLLLLPALLVTLMALGCDSKPAKPPTPKIDAPATADTPAKKAEPREESPAQIGY